jgi:hypothetical protein
MRYAIAKANRKACASAYHCHIESATNRSRHMNTTRQDVQMERIYRLVPTIGFKRAIAEVACGETEQLELAQRYEHEMSEFVEAGGI